MATVVSICNQAMGWLGANPITSLNDNTTESRLCSANYDDLRRAVLEDVAWTFAAGRMRLDAIAADDDVDDWGERDRFKIKNLDKVITINRVYYDQKEDLQADDWIREGEYISIPALGSRYLFIKYTKDIENPRLFPPGFVQALAARLAADLAIPITQSRQLQEDMWALYSAKVKSAAANDGSQGSNERIERSRLVRVRGR